MYRHFPPHLAQLPGPLVRDAKCREIVEFASAAVNVDNTGIGSSPWLGDLASTGVAVPKEPTRSQECRYLIRLCGVEIPLGDALIVRGIRQAVTLRGTPRPIPLPLVEERSAFGAVLAAAPAPSALAPAAPPTESLVIKRQVVSPFWHFIDGNVTWHLRWQPNQFAPDTTDPVQQVGTSPQMRGLDPTLLYNRPYGPPISPYVPPAAGQPPGVAVGDFGAWRDLRFPWVWNNWMMSEVLVGPGAVVLYASVHQTDPENRPVYPNLPGMVPEDLFLSSFPDARYDRVMGSLIVELCPRCIKEAS